MLNHAEHIVGYDCENESDFALAGETLWTLIQAYPAYDWFVTVRGGVLQVKVGSWSDKWGMAIHLNDINQDAGIRRKAIIRAGGEFLERAHMRRGRATEDKLQVIEGVPDKDLARAKLLQV